METGNIKHIGVVTAVDSSGELTVKIARNQCDGCQLGKLCNVSGDDELKVSIPVTEITDYTEGTRVLVEEGQDLEKTAIWLCLVIPCVLFMAIVLAGSILFSAAAGCIAGIVLLVIYYGAFYLLRDKNRYNKIIYKVKKI